MVFRQEREHLFHLAWQISVVCTVIGQRTRLYEGLYSVVCKFHKKGNDVAIANGWCNIRCCCHCLLLLSNGNGNGNSHCCCHLWQMADVTISQTEDCQGKLLCIWLLACQTWWTHNRDGCIAGSSGNQRWFRESYNDIMILSISTLVDFLCCGLIVWLFFDVFQGVS